MVEQENSNNNNMSALISDTNDRDELVRLANEIKKSICQLEQEILRAFHEDQVQKMMEENKENEIDTEGNNTSNNVINENKDEPEKDSKIQAQNNSNDGDTGADEEEEPQEDQGEEEKSPEESKDEDDDGIWKPPKYCVPIRADVRNFDFKDLVQSQLRATGRKFDVIMTDPPWQLATSNPTRGVALGYQQLSDALIEQIPFSMLQDNGFIFVWVINAKYKFALDLFEKWGYELVDEITWVKRTVNRRLAKSHGFYLQHAKETCLVGKKGNANPPGTVENAASDVIFSERRGQSQKPTEIYEIIEKLVPGGTYLEIFGRRNNLRDYWVTLGNEL